MGVQPTKETFRGYLFFLGGQLFSLFGSSVISFALIFWITELTQDEVIIAIGAFLFFVPLVLLTPIAGVFTDKYDRKKLILLADSGQAVITFGLILVFMLGVTNVWLVILINSLRSICQAFHQPVVNSIIPTMVPKDKLSRINGLNYLMTGVVQVVGPLVGGILVAFIAIEIIFWIDIITFFIALTPLLLIKIPSVNGASKKVTTQMKDENNFKTDLKEGLNIIRNIPGMISLIFLSMLVNFLIRPIDTQMSFFILIYHEGGALDFALISASFQAGVVIGAIITSLKKEWNKKILVTIFGIIFFNVGYGLLGLTPKGFFLMLTVFGFMMGFVLPIINTIFMTIIQLNVPVEKIGRVHAIDSTLSMAISPIGILISGPLAKLFGVQNLFIYCALLGIFVTIILWATTDIRKLGTYHEKETEKIKKGEEIKLKAPLEVEEI
jgi:MFS transporter, DHA3 family, macrolide efflux protein